MRIDPSGGFSPFKSIPDRGASVFRLDINALRALSVVAVVGFHLRIPGFTGGFVGVDIFLVITGYLMTLKVLRDLSQGGFSFWRFWIMRMRRIYPALAVVTVSDATCSECGAPVADENVEEVIAPTQLASSLLETMLPLKS